MLKSSKSHQQYQQSQNGGKPENVSEKIAWPVQQRRAAFVAADAGAGLFRAARITFNVCHFLNREAYEILG